MFVTRGRFYDAMPGNAWMLNATEYGHGDCLEDFFVWAIGVSKGSAFSAAV